jgi:UPF0755 protein
MKKVLAILVALVILGVAGVSFLAIGFLAKRPSASTEKILFDVQPGESFAAVANRLEQNGLITDAFKFRILARVTGAGTKVRVGEYAIAPNSLPREVLNSITSGRSVEYSMTFQEGINIYEMAAAFDRQGLISGKEFLALCKDPQFLTETVGEALESCEGYLFPETYKFTKFTSARVLMRNMISNFIDNYNSITPNPAVDLNRHEIVTLASIIEKETGAVDERQLVSSVFHNRLRKGMRLQTDPTIVYGILDSGKPYAGNIRKSDLLAPTRYNTYVISGLPPGPIANPGKQSLYAAIYPARSDYLFFVSRNDGTHVFSEDYKGHSKAVGQFQLDAKAREGKSWRELTKKQSQVREQRVKPSPTPKRKR